MSFLSHGGLTLEERVCNICLSSDRKLHAMSNMVITQDWRDIGLNIQHGVLCWECRAVINKVTSFKTKAMCAQQVFKRKLEPSKLKSLSTLNYRFNDTRDYFYKLHTDPDNNFQTIVENEIKEESVSDDAQSNSDLYENSGNIPLENRHEMYKNHTEFVEIDIKEDEIKDLDVKHNTATEKEAINKNLDEVTTKTEENDRYKNSNHYFVCTLSEEEVLNQRERDKTMIQYLKTSYKCETCVRPFRSMQSYAAHMVECHSKDIGDFVCELCACRFSNQLMLDVHIKSHRVLYRCGICRHHQFYYRDLVQMKKHMTNSHGEYTCEMCPAVFNSRSTFRYHKRTQHKSKEHCDQCGKETTNLKIHQETHNKTPTEECTICHKLLKTRTSLRFHMMTHTKPNKHEAYCAECDIYFKNKHIYKSHLKNNARHAKADKECDYCHKMFISKFSLVKHINVVHFNKLDHVCHLCGKKFSVTSHLRNHIKVFHEGIAKPRKHVCELCGKGFAVKRILDDHMNTHTGARPYKCDKCPSQFGFKAALYMHNRLKHLKLKKGGKTKTDGHSKKIDTT